MARRLNEDHSDHSGSTTACACGQTARYAGRRPKTFTSVLGPLTLERAYYHCDACRAGICPRDRALGLHATSLSPGVLRMVGLAASDFSFAAVKSKGYFDEASMHAMSKTVHGMMLTEFANAKEFAQVIEKRRVKNVFVSTFDGDGRSGGRVLHLYRNAEFFAESFGGIYGGCGEIC